MTTLVKKSEEQIPNANQPRNGLEQLATPKKNIKTFDPATIDWDAIVTEDDTPVENYNTEQHGGLLTDTLYTNWLHSKYGNRFIAAADVGVFSAPDEPAIVPDIFLSLGLQKPADKSHKRNVPILFGMWVSSPMLSSRLSRMMKAAKIQPRWLVMHAWKSSLCNL